MTATAAVPIQHRLELLGQTVVVLGGSAGIGFETARRARAEGADVILAARNPDRLAAAAQELGALSSTAFDALNPEQLERFFDDLPGPVDHVLVTAGGPYYSLLADIDFDTALRNLDEELIFPLRLARAAQPHLRSGGTLIFISGTGGRHAAPGFALIGAVTAAHQAMIASLALELAPLRINLIAAGFVDTPLSASILGDGLEARREQLRATLPIGRVVGPQDVAALAVHLMANTALTGATYDVDGGQQFAPAAWG